MKRIVAIILLSVAIICAHAQNFDTIDGMREALDHMFAQIDKSFVPTGLLIDNAIEYEDLSKYSPEKGITEENVVDILKYGSILETIKSASLSSNPLLAFEKELEFTKDKEGREPSVRISISLFEYAQIRANAIEEGKLTFDKGQVFCSSAEAYQKKIVCAGCIMDDTKNTTDLIFSLPNKYVLSNIGIKDVSLDYGYGYVSVSNKNVKAHLSEGKHTITFKITDCDGNVYYSHSSLRILSLEHASTRAAGSFADDEFAVTGQPYHGISTTANISVKFAPGNVSGKIRKPLIYVEGFDPRELNPNGRGAISFYNTYTQWSNFICNNDYDFIYVDWQDAGEYIQANAYTLIEVIKDINTRTDALSVPAVVIGHSMGGLVSRYALKTMENNHQEHHVGAYVSFDSPHMGANVPLSILYGYHGLISFLKEKNILSSLLNKWTDAERLIAIGDRLAYSTAAQQMLLNYVDPAGNLNNTVHVQWQKELKNLGFPNGDTGKEFKRIAIANSDYTLPNTNTPLLSCDLSAGSNITTVIAPLLSAVTTVLLQDVVAGLLVMLPGRDEVKGVFECLPSATIGEKITHISIGYKKTFLWTIPISKTIFSYDRYHSGNCLYDTYSASRWGADKINLPSSSSYSSILGYYGADIKLASGIPFIPTASALAVGDGINNNPSQFSTAPSGNVSPFGEAYYMESIANYQRHLSISPNAKTWIESQLATTIIGPSTGYTGVKYQLSVASSGVVWNSSDTSIATINQQGVLNVFGNGLVHITAMYHGVTYSKTIMVGMPKYILAASHEPNGFKINANLITSQFSNTSEQINKIVSYHWGVKFPNKQIVWDVTNEPSILVPLEDKNVTVYFKVCDSNGNYGQIQYINAQAQDVFSVTNGILEVDASKCIYKSDGSAYSYKNGKIYLTRNTSLPSEYQHDIWTSTKAVVFSPFGANYTIPVSKGALSIKNVFPDAEINYIIQNSISGKTYVYMTALLNPENKIVQLVPISITFK